MISPEPTSRGCQWQGKLVRLIQSMSTSAKVRSITTCVPHHCIGLTACQIRCIHWGYRTAVAYNGAISPSCNALHHPDLFHLYHRSPLRKLSHIFELKVPSNVSLAPACATLYILPTPAML